MRMMLLTCSFLSACASGPPPSEPPPQAPPPELPAGDGPRLTMRSPEPPLGEGWLDAWIFADGFPAISDDGALVVDARSLEDGARGMPNLVVEAYAVADGGAIFTAVIVSTDGAGVDYMLDEALPTATLGAARAAFTAAQAFLAGRRWHRLAELTPARWDSEEDDFTFFSDDGALAVQFREPRLFVDHAAKPDQLARDFPAWSAPPGDDLCADDPDAPAESCRCVNDAKADAFWLDAARSVLVVEIGYRGSDACWEPEARLFPLPLPTDPARTWTRVARDAQAMGITYAWGKLDLPEQDPDDEAVERARTFLRQWERRFSNAPEVIDTRALIEGRR